ncbi:hypothetical protein D8676_25815 [Mesorhizobium sp. YM1C-6-2]|nr:hypothetical protein D8676_25815 [Mesorhizobium sp. YM1C-6-2]
MPSFELALRSSSRPNPIPAAFLAADERRAELCGLLALGLVRLRSRQSSELSAGPENGLLDCAADRSGHATVVEQRNA